jgi:glycerol-3-phosphate dehydrogenase
VSVLGGKWTTYRKMAEDTLSAAAMVGGLQTKKCKTRKLKLFGYEAGLSFDDPLHVYGSERTKVLSEGPEFQNKSLSDKYYISKNQILYSMRHEMAMRLEDVIARRVRALFLDARETQRLLPEIAQIMAKELHKDADWIKNEIKHTEQILKTYLL